MKYIFLTILHNLKLQNSYNTGREISIGMRISNGKGNLSRITETRLLESTLGIHSINEFNGKSYVYMSGEFDDISTKEQMDEKGSMCTFQLLRKAEQFVLCTWNVKDNNIYVRDGFLVVYSDNIEDGFTYKAALTTIYGKASGDNSETIFTDDELSNAISYFSHLNYGRFKLDEIELESFGGKYPQFDHFYKSQRYSRKERVKYFVIAARGNPALPMKIVLYCTALECLFSTSNTEVNHKIAERVACLIGLEVVGKVDTYNFIKKAYDLRSKIIHGSVIKTQEGQLIAFSTRLDEILRRLIVENYDVFDMSDNEMDDYFINELFTGIQTNEEILMGMPK
ncbi:HEPN domain-containing protein [Paenibacillus aquistagni]|uniref:Uncharacterized protein n=1 Tax=Paenibacillus aquistagni TaxID=1852522 RepID=A0A1X7LYJ1_9BACL|nr:HEPN domain-containing protein [Paenibacillus aquistagni]SMG58179.1 hypothetical protein SAMN06295960_4631 [Paenibacillus aquistagni]